MSTASPIFRALLALQVNKDLKKRSKQANKKISLCLLLLAIIYTLFLYHRTGWFPLLVSSKSNSSCELTPSVCFALLLVAHEQLLKRLHQLPPSQPLSLPRGGRWLDILGKRIKPSGLSIIQKICFKIMKH